MGQSNAKEQGAQNVKNGSGNGLAIQSAPTFDSHFTLISPKSDLSDPSKFFYQPPEVKNPQLMKGHHQRLERNHSQVVFHNMPVIPEKKKNGKRKKKKLTYHKKKSSARQLPNGGNGDNRTKTQRVKDVFSGCVVASSEQAQKLRDVSNNISRAATIYTKKSGGEWANTKERKMHLNAALAIDEKKDTRTTSDERKHRSLSTAAKSSLNIKQNKPKPPPANGRPANLEETVTPLAQLDSCFKKVCLHHEEAYFERLTGSMDPAPSPVASDEPESLNSTRSVIGQHESIQKTSSGVSSIARESRAKSQEEKPFGKDSAIGPSQTNYQDQQRSKGGAYFRLNANQRRKSSESHIRRGVTKDMDYRNIALCKSEGDTPGRACLPSPSNSVASSTMSSVAGCPRGALVGDQALSNAAFLFSPSYAGGNAGLLKREKKYRDPAFSISTFASRARLSNVSSRSQPSFTIPVSKSWDSHGSVGSKSKRYDFSGVGSVDTNNSKQVSFSNSNQTFEIQKSSRNNIREIQTPVIETKLSDLTESTVLQNQATIDEASGVTTAHAQTALEEERVSSRHSEEEIQSTTSSDRLGSRSSRSSRSSIHWGYREEDGKITATPKLRKKWGENGAQPSKSPALRFHAAKAKFSVGQAKANDHGFSGLSHDSDDSTSKQVRFSDSNETFNSVTNQIEQILAPSIETKISDLTEVKILQSQDNTDEVSVGTTTSSISLHSDSREGSLAQDTSPRHSEHDCHSATSSQRQGSIHWAYHEEHGKITATPKLGIKKEKAGAKPATSPLKRFNEAKHKFSSQRTKVVPVKKTPPKKFSNRTPKKTLVSSRISELRNKLNNDIHQQLSHDITDESVFAENRSIENETDGGGAEDVTRFTNDNSVAEESIVTTEDLFTSLLRSETDIDDQSSNLRYRTKMDEKKNSFIANYQQQALNVDRDDFDEATHFSTTEEIVHNEGSVSTVDDVFTTLLRSKTEMDDESLAESINEPKKDKHKRLSSQYPGRPSFSGEDHLSDLVKVDDDLVSIAETECSEDPFADVLRSNYEVDKSARRRNVSTGSRNSVFSFATNCTNRESFDSYANDKENSVSLNTIHKITSGGQVNPVNAYHPENPSNLCLSPTQRTPMQARKWRTLAAASTQKQSSTKGINKKRNNKGRRGGLHERSVNVK